MHNKKLKKQGCSELNNHSLHYSPAIQKGIKRKIRNHIHRGGFNVAQNPLWVMAVVVLGFMLPWPVIRLAIYLGGLVEGPILKILDRWWLMPLPWAEGAGAKLEMVTLGSKKGYRAIQTFFVYKYFVTTSVMAGIVIPMLLKYSGHREIEIGLVWMILSNLMIVLPAAFVGAWVWEWMRLRNMMIVYTDVVWIIIAKPILGIGFDPILSFGPTKAIGELKAATVPDRLSKSQVTPWLLARRFTRLAKIIGLGFIFIASKLLGAADFVGPFDFYWGVLRICIDLSKEADLRSQRWSMYVEMGLRASTGDPGKGWTVMKGQEMYEEYMQRALQAMPKTGRKINLWDEVDPGLHDPRKVWEKNSPVPVFSAKEPFWERLWQRIIGNDPEAIEDTQGDQTAGGLPATPAPQQRQSMVGMNLSFQPPAPPTLEEGELERPQNRTQVNWEARLTALGGGARFLDRIENGRETAEQLYYETGFPPADVVELLREGNTFAQIQKIARAQTQLAQADTGLAPEQEEALLAADEDRYQHLAEHEDRTEENFEDAWQALYKKRRKLEDAKFYEGLLRGWFLRHGVWPQMVYTKWMSGMTLKDMQKLYSRS